MWKERTASTSGLLITALRFRLSVNKKKEQPTLPAVNQNTPHFSDEMINQTSRTSINQRALPEVNRNIFALPVVNKNIFALPLVNKNIVSLSAGDQRKKNRTRWFKQTMHIRSPNKQYLSLLIVFSNNVRHFGHRSIVDKMYDDVITCIITI